MDISNGKYKFGALNRHNLEASARLMAEVFLAENKIWATLAPTPEQTYNFMLAKTSEMLDWEEELRQDGTIGKDTFLSFVFMDQQDNILATWTNFQLTQYLSKKSKVKLPQFQFLETTGEKLQEQGIDPRDKVRGQSIYAMFAAIKPSMISRGLSEYCWMTGADYLYSKGFRVSYTRSSNIRSYGLMVKCGGVMTARVKVVKNGQNMTLSFMKNPLTPLDRSPLLQKQKRKPLL